MPRHGSVPDDLHEWISFEDPDEDRTWLLDATFLTSNWTCIYGRGCQGVLDEDATAAVTAKFATSAELKQSSLASAIATLKGTKGGTEAVQAAYVQFFQDKKAGASKIDEKAETAAARAAIVTKLNAVAKNEGFFFEFDAEGKPKMVV